jgi:NAD(P)-dependent dehydrogenase (short-subunit alcohol dehydrogenase family)
VAWLRDETHEILTAGATALEDNGQLAMNRLDGKVALVTGAGRRNGLGEAICIRLAEAGARIVVTDIGQPAGNLSAGNIGSAGEMEAVADDIRSAGGEAVVAPMDVRDETQVVGAIERAVSAYGQLDILVNNAGIGFLMKPLVEMTADQWRTVLDVNLTGAFLCTKHAAAQMIRQGHGGRIINIASQAAKSGHRHMAAYTASKHGMVGLTRSSAMEFGPHGITVNAVCPNHVTTGLGAVQNEYFARLNGQTVDEYLAAMRARIPLQRVGLPADTAGAVAFLCSDEGAYITGEAMNVSGGVEMH